MGALKSYELALFLVMGSSVLLLSIKILQICTALKPHGSRMLVCLDLNALRMIAGVDEGTVLQLSSKGQNGSS